MRKYTLTPRKISKHFFVLKVKARLDHSTITRGFEYFCSGCENLFNQARSNRLKTKGSKVVLLATGVNSLSSCRRVSGELSIS